MFSSSINNRLWLTYLVIVLFVLLIAFVGIAVAFRNSPMLYRQVFYRISLVNGFLRERLALVIDGEWEPFIRLFLEEVKIFDVNVAILDAQGNIAYSSGTNEIASFPGLKDPSSIVDQSRDSILLYKDENRQTWFYQISPINSSFFLVTSALRPEISISSVFQDELMAPLIRAGIVALILSFILGLFIARWITRPLQKISISAGQIAEGNYVRVPIEGPLEVRQLAGVINDMVAKVQDSMQSQKDFVANVSHEFKTPLTSIQGFAQALFDGAIDNKSEKQRAARIILGETERLNFLVNDLLTLAMLDAGTIVMEKSLVDLNQLIRNILEKLQFQINLADINVNKKLAEPMVFPMDAERISQVLNNLIDNAIKFSPKGESIIISTSIERKNAIFLVSDSGPGISEDNQKRIFERFFQTDKSRKGGQGRGVGLGLSIAKQIVIAHGGSISVKSHLSQGSTFMVKLPLANGQKNKSSN
ncbi:MAG: HAMP domain-containing sensor histidine kinase [Pelolinea sp.]|nr:HAMP domain-containing sensor histidine kinase [Pelolinea sp.]